MTTSTSQSSTTHDAVERADLLQLLGARRQFLRYTAKDLTEEQAAASPTVSALCIGGLIKHVTHTESAWIQFILGDKSGLSGGKDWSEWDESDWAARAAEFRMLPGETLAGVLEEYDKVARRTDELVQSLPDLNEKHLLPEAPWFQPGEERSTRAVLLHIAAETAHHSGHADIIRETIDGSKTMG